MKRIHFLTLLVAIILSSCNNAPKNNKQEKSNKQTTENTDSHTAEISLDWNGTYQGLLPCASCPGIVSEVKLNNDKTFEKSDLYLSSKDGYFNEEGTFSFTKDGGKVVLKTKSATFMYAVGENKLILLDKDGKKSTSELAAMYELSKLSDDNIEFTNKPIKGLLTFGHEVEAFQPCGSSKIYWINDDSGKLMRLYNQKVGKTSTPYTPIMAKLVVKNMGKAKDGFPEDYESVLKVIAIKSVEPITPENFCRR